MLHKWDDVENCQRCQATLDGYKVGVNIQEGGCEEVICWYCDRVDKIQDYFRTGEMTSGLVTEAVLCECWKGDFSQLRPDCVKFFQTYQTTLLEIAAKNKQINRRAGEWEEKYWIGKLQKYYQESKDRGHSAETDTYKAMLWGSAGRVMLTIQDKYHKDHPQSKFGGAWISLIFDEDSLEPRGGIQGYCATFEEAMGLLNAAYENFPQMTPNSDVHMIGTR